jgi:hypothetical protein
MYFYGMDDFQEICKQKLIGWYHKYKHIELNGDNVYVVWSCKTLQNFKALLSTDVNGDGVYAEYIFNGDKNELYEDVYQKTSNTCYKE